MTTTFDSIVLPAKSHRRGVAFIVAGVLLIGGAAATTAVVLDGNGDSTPAPAIATTNHDAPLQDPLLMRFGHTADQNAAPEPMLRLGGPR